MGARQHNSERMLESDLPKLAPDARARVRTAELHATEASLEHGRAACKQFLEATEVSPNAGEAKRAGRAAALSVLLRAFRDEKIRAGLALFDAVAAEYLPVDRNAETYSERLTLTVRPFVLRRLEIGRHDRLIEGAISTAVLEWETGRMMPTALPTTLARKSPAEVIEEFMSGDRTPDKVVLERGRPKGTPVSGEKLRTFRGKLSQLQFANECGVSLDTIQRGEAGDRWDEKTFITVAENITALKRKDVTPEDLKNRKN
jgi:hypothetical protein